MDNHKQNRNPQEQKGRLNKFVRFTGIAFQMGAIIFLGNKLGTWLSSKFNNPNLENIVTLAAVFLAMYTVIAQVIKVSKENG